MTDRSGAEGQKDGTEVPEEKPDPSHADSAEFAPGQNVAIRLDFDPRYRAPMTTLLSPGKKTFSIHFKEDMKRETVEEALRQNTAANDANGQPQSGQPKLQFQWHTNRYLQVTVETEATEQELEPFYSVFGFRLDVNGARTAEDTVLEDEPRFEAYLQKPTQLWRISADGGKREKLTDLNEPYRLSLLDDDKRYALAAQTTGYCECDAMSPQMYTVIDLREGTMIPYPNELYLTYWGPGSFVVDTRGFFYSKQDLDQDKIPASETAYNIEVHGYVHGASLSKDRNHVIMAVGAPEQESELDLIIYNIKDGTKRQYPKAIGGTIPKNMLTDGNMPVFFNDDGKSFYFHMTGDAFGQSLSYVYHWDTERLEPWAGPEGIYEPSYFASSSDALYRFHSDGHLYKDGHKMEDSLIQAYAGTWLPGTHTYVFIDPNLNPDNPHTSRIKAYDADGNRVSDVASGLSPLGIVGASADGQWIYVTSENDIR